MYDEKIFALLKGSTILDPEVFKKKNKFFYNTSYDILIKGDLGNTSRYLDIFKEFERKARIVKHNNKHNLPIKDKTMPLPKNKRNKLQVHNSIDDSNHISNKSQAILLKTKDKEKTVNSLSFKATRSSSLVGQSFDQSKLRKSTSNITVHKQDSVNSRMELRINKKLLPKANSISKYPNTHTNKAKAKKSQFNLMERNPKLVKLLNQKPSKNKQNNKAILLSNDRSRTLEILRDYFKSKHYNQIKSRYIQLFGRETISQRIKNTNKIIMNATISPSGKEEKKEYVKVLNNNSGSFNISKKKYETIGAVKVLNVPIDFYNSSDIYYSEDKSIFAQNAKKMYEIEGRAEKRMKRYSAYLSRSKNMSAMNAVNNKNKDDTPLTRILRKFKQCESKGMKIKNQILNSKQFFDRKSPIIDNKIFAYIDTELKKNMKFEHSIKDNNKTTRDKDNNNKAKHYGNKSANIRPSTFDISLSTKRKK